MDTHLQKVFISDLSTLKYPFPWRRAFLESGQEISIKGFLDDCIPVHLGKKTFLIKHGL